MLSERASSSSLTRSVSVTSLERLAVYYTLPDKALMDGAKAQNWGSLFVSTLVNEAPYNVITPRIYLGALPRYQLPDNIGMVVSISTYEELARFDVPETIQHLFLHVPDKTSIVPASDGLRVVLQMREFLKADPDNVILIHCKQGHSRSMMILAALLVISPVEHELPSDLTLEEACKLIEKKRRLAHVEPDKLAKANEIIDLYRERPDVTIKSLKGDGVTAAKDALRQTREFMKFMVYATKKYHTDPALARALESFLFGLLHAEDFSAFESVVKGDHPLIGFAAKDPVLTGLLFRLDEGIVRILAELAGLRPLVCSP